LFGVHVFAGGGDVVVDIALVDMKTAESRSTFVGMITSTIIIIFGFKCMLMKFDFMMEIHHCM